MPARWLRATGWSAVAAGVFGVLGTAAGFAFSGDGVEPEHRLHWVSHLAGTPTGLALMGALAGVVRLERGALGRAGLVAIGTGGLSAAVGALGGALVGWAGGVQGVTDGGLYDLGHRVGDLGVLGLPAGLALSALVGLRARVLPRWSGWLPFAAIPVAVLAGVILGALGRDAGVAAVIVMAAGSLQLAVWGQTMLSRPALPSPRPLWVEPEPMRAS